MDRETGYQSRPILIRGNVLLWLRGGLTLRLEGRLSKAQALELARRIADIPLPGEIRGRRSSEYRVYGCGRRRLCTGDRDGEGRALARGGARPRRLRPQRRRRAGARHDIDLHLAVELIEQGCPYETAIEILI
jgi:hypothetical protein